jgi:hypothetical protein
MLFGGDPVNTIQAARVYQTSGTHYVKATITSKTPENLFDESIDVEVRFDCAGMIYNPTLESLPPTPAQLLVFDDRGYFVCDLLGKHIGSQRLPDEKDCQFFGSGSFVGRTFTFSRAKLDNLCVFWGHQQLRRGKIRLQLIVNEAFVMTPPRKYDDPQVTAEENARWEAAWKNRDICRSNVLEFKLTER